MTVLLTAIISLVQCFFYGSIAGICFAVVFLQDIGYNLVECGNIMTMSDILFLVIQPTTIIIQKRFNFFRLTNSSIFILIIDIILCVSLIISKATLESSKIPVTILYTLICVVTRSSFTFIFTIGLKCLRNYKITLCIVDASGWVGYGITSYIIGKYQKQHSNSCIIALIINALLCITFVLISSFVVKEMKKQQTITTEEFDENNNEVYRNKGFDENLVEMVKVEKKENNNGVVDDKDKTGEKDDKTGEKDDAKVECATKNPGKLSLIMYFLCYGFIFSAHIGVDHFMINVVNNIGYGVYEVGVIHAISSTVSIPSVLMYECIVKYFKPIHVLRFSTAAICLKITTTYYAYNIYTLYAATLIQLFGFPLFNVSMNYYLSQYKNDTLSCIHVFVVGLSIGISNFSAAQIISNFGIKICIFICSVLSSLSIVFSLFMKGFTHI